MSYFVYQKHLLERVRISFGRIVVMILAALKRIIDDHPKKSNKGYPLQQILKTHFSNQPFVCAFVAQNHQPLLVGLWSLSV